MLVLLTKTLRVKGDYSKILLLTSTTPYSSHAQTFWSQDPFTILEIIEDLGSNQESEITEWFK